MLEEFIKYILGEWRMIAQSPVSFFVALIVVGLLIWGATTWGYGREMSLLKEQVADYKNKLSSKADASKAKIDELETQFPKWPHPYQPTSVVGKAFRNERVILDGKSYSHCIFENVTFVYNGTTTIQFSNNKILGSAWYASDNPAVLGTLGWMRGFGLVKDGVIIDAGINIIETPQFMDRK